MNTTTIGLIALPLMLLAGCGGESSGSAAGGSSTAGPASLPPLPVITTPWAPVGPAPPAIQAPVAAHSPSGTIYIGSFGGGVLKSTDRGGTFRAVNNGLSLLTVATMAMAPDDPNTLYVSTFGGGSFKTVDGGANWAPVPEGGAPLIMVVDPTNANNVFIGFNGAVPVRRSTDGGTTWSSATGIPANSPVFGLAIDPRDPRVMYAGTAGNGAYKSVDRGATWTAMTVDSTVWTVTVDPADSRTIYAGGNGSGVFRSVDAGATFTRLGTPGDGVVLSIARSGSLLYAGTASSGLQVSSDNGVTWSASSISSGLVISLNVDGAGNVYAGTGLRGALTAGPGGTTFLPIGLLALQSCRCQNVYYASVDPSNSRRVMLGTNDGGLIETYDGGSNWNDAGAGGFANRSPRAIVFDPTNSQRVYAGSFTGGGFFRSADGGRTWQRRLFGPSTLHVANIAVDASDQSVYVVTLQNGGVWKSTNLGDTFTRVDVGVAGGPFLNLAGRGIAVDASTPSTLYIAGPTGTWQSLNRGATWTRVSTVAALTVAVDPTSSRNVYVGTNANGVLKSTNGGSTFTASNVGLTDLRTSRGGSVQIHRSDPNTLYVGTEGGGVFKSTDAGGSWVAINGSLTELTVYGLAMDPGDPKVLYATGPQSVFKTVSGGQ
jgi:photosystem II stability/assembly factor-like uncharacterized protein